MQGSSRGMSNTVSPGAPEAAQVSPTTADAVAAEGGSSASGAAAQPLPPLPPMSHIPCSSSHVHTYVMWKAQGNAYA